MTSQLNKYVYVNYLVQVMNVGVNFAYSLIIVHLLGASGYGGYSVFFNSLAFSLLLLGFNIPSVIIFFIANKKIDPGKLLFSSLVFTFIMSILLWALLASSDTLGFAIHIFPGGNNTTNWILLFVLQFFLLQLNQVMTAFLNAHKIFIPVAIATLVMNIALLLYWVFASMGIISLPAALFDRIWWVNILLNAGLLIYLLTLLGNQFIAPLTSRLIGMRELKALAGFAIIVYLCNTIQFLNYKMDIWFIHYFDGDADAGVYALALSLSQLIWILPNAMSAVLLNYYQVHEREEAFQMAINYGSLSIYFSLFAAIALSVVYYFALPAIYGPQFSRVAVYCVFLFLGAVPFSLAIIIANLNSGIGFVRINLYATIFSFVLGVLLDLLLIPVYGITGALIAKVTVYATGVLFHIIVGHNLYKLPWQQLFRFPNIHQLRKRLITRN